MKNILSKSYETFHSGYSCRPEQTCFSFSQSTVTLHRLVILRFSCWLFGKFLFYYLIKQLGGPAGNCFSVFGWEAFLCFLAVNRFSYLILESKFLDSCYFLGKLFFSGILEYFFNNRLVCLVEWTFFVGLGACSLPHGYFESRFKLFGEHFIDVLYYILSQYCFTF